MSLTLEQTYRQYFPLLREKCRRMLLDGEEAQDVAQEALIRFWKSNLDDIEPGQVAAWLYRTSTRLAIDRVRSRASKVAEPDHAQEELNFTLKGPDDALISRQALTALAQKVPAKELEVAILHRMDGLTQPELAEVLGISDRTVRRLLGKLDDRLNRLRKEV